MDEYEREADRYLYHPSDDEFEGDSSDGPHSYSDDGYENVYIGLEQKALQDEEEEQDGQTNYYSENRHLYSPERESFGDVFSKVVFYATYLFIGASVLWAIIGAIWSMF